jgi:soluble lytic murein transglycosylase-like protein
LGTAINLINCTKVRRERRDMRFFRGAARRLLFAAFLGCAVPAAAPHDFDPSDRGEPEQPSAPPGPHPHDSSNPAGPASDLPTSTSASICLLVESAAQAHGLPFEFFARLIWQESRFKPNAVGPTTRSGGRAQGIAQFMPSTAREHGVLDPFDPIAALPKSAEFLQELLAQFGNLGLAAAAYNAGPKRVRDWLDGRGSLPGETRSYVIAITGRSAEAWAAAAGNHEDLPPAKRASCGELIAMLKEKPTPFIGELERHVREGAERPWGVQLSAGFGRERVLAAYAAAERSYPTILENRDPIIVEGKFRSRGTQTFYQVRVGADTRAAADALCGALRNAGGACLVLRNPTG